jgi:alkylglycerol monooxygenase
MNYVAFAVPFFLLLIILEITWGILRKTNTYRVNDSINSLSLGMLSTLTKLVILNIGMLIFQRIEHSGQWLTMSTGSALHWVLGILLYDFCYYWFHRISHERILFWGSHVVHHQSEDFNLSTALRQTSTGIFTTWIFYLPLFFLGMPIEMYISIASLHLIYQFWIHTQFVPKLGPIEWLFVTPSNHRVHHAQNTRYVDRNYGGLLCIWDRAFGTYSEESDDEPIIYGITTPLNTWNPLWANMHIFTGMLRDAWYTRRVKDKLNVFTARTGWRPEDVEKRFPANKSQLNNFQKYNPELSRTSKFSLTALYMLATVVYFWLVPQSATLSLMQLYLSLAFTLLMLVSIGMLADQSKHSRRWELIRFVFSIVLLGIADFGGFFDRTIILAGIALLVTSCFFSWLAIISARADADLGQVAH